jgi:hypothetical protein
VGAVESRKTVDPCAVLKRLRDSLDVVTAKMKGERFGMHADLAVDAEGMGQFT